MRTLGVKMKVYQVINDSITDGCYLTKEGAAMRLFEIVMRTKNILLSDLLRVDELEAK